MSSVDPQIWRRVTSFLLAAETAALQNTCKTFLQRPMPYFFGKLTSIATVLHLQLSQRMQSVTIEYGYAGNWTSSDLMAMILISRQIPMQIQQIQIPLNIDRRPSYEAFVFEDFLLSACSKNITLLVDNPCHHQSEKAQIFICRLLQFPNVGRVLIDATVFLFMVKRHNITDERLRMRSLLVDDAMRDENLSFLLSRLDEKCDVVKFRSLGLTFVTAQQIVDFCAAVVSKFASCSSKNLHFSISASIDTNENHEGAFDSVDKMMRLPNRTGNFALYHHQNFTTVRFWE
jgi:hypothetical protein